MNDGSNQLTPCRDCQNPCSSSAKSCPKCGCDDPTGKIAEAQAIQVAAQVEAQQKIVADLEAQQEAVKKTERQCFRTDNSKSTACGVSYHESNVKK